jgi:hypothetical protein
VAVTVSLREVVDELESLTEESTLYLDRETGELYAIGDEEARLVEDGAAATDLPDWLHDELPRIREVLTGQRWLSLPTRFDIHEWAIMDEFAQASDDPGVRDELLTAIHGLGAFRAFRDAVHRRGLQESWYRYRASAVARIAMAWLDEHDIAYTRDSDGDFRLAAGMDPA